MMVEVARGWDLFRLGAFGEAESLVSTETHDLQAVRLLLWIAIRRGDAERKLQYGQVLAQATDPNLAAIGRAHENVALATMERDIKPWHAPSSRAAQAEVAYARALIAFMRGLPGAVRAELSSALPQSPEQRVRYAQLRAWSKALNDDFVGQAHLLTQALGIGLKENVDRSLTAIIAGSLALIAREVDLEEIGTYTDSLLEQVEWPLDPSHYTFYAKWGMAWRNAVKGDWIRAMRMLDEASHSAPDAKRLGLIYVDRARISVAIGECVASETWVRLAYQHFDAIDWKTARNDEAIDVMSTMDALTVQPERARDLLEKASSTQVSKMTGGGHGARFDAFRHYAQAHLAAGEDGLAHAHVAYRAFKEIKYLQRAASCAIRAVELGGGARWRTRVERLVAPYPRSLAAQQYARVTSPLSRISGRRKEVMDLLVTTSNTAGQIGTTLGITEGTVRVHIKQLKRILGVENRSQLVRLYLEANSKGAISEGARERITVVEGLKQIKPA